MWTPQEISSILTQLGSIIGAITVIVKLIEANKQQTTVHALFASKALDIANEPSTTNVTNPTPEPLMTAVPLGIISKTPNPTGTS